MTKRKFLMCSLLYCAALHAATISTVAGTGKQALGEMSGAADTVNIGQPFGVEVGPDGALYITEVENHRVLRLDLSTKQVTTVAGTGKQGGGGNGGAATSAAMFEPYEVRFDKAGNMYVTEMKGAVVRKIDAKTKIISLIAGTGTPGFSGDGGPADKAQLNQPHSIALDENDGLYIADIGNNRIRKVDLKTGIITTIAGDGTPKATKSGAKAAGQPLRGPRALCVQKNTLWIALREGHSVWKLDLPSNEITHVAGTGKVGFHDGAATEATFNGPKGIVAGPNNELFVMDTENHAVRRVDATTGAVSTLAGGGPTSKGFGGDGGDALQAKMDRPHGIAADASGTIYIGDTNNHRVRKVSK
jgi:streptogramin lyase